VLPEPTQTGPKKKKKKTQNLVLLFALVLSRRAHTATDWIKSISHTLTVRKM
jgi:hypothetical protein